MNTLDKLQLALDTAVAQMNGKHPSELGLTTRVSDALQELIPGVPEWVTDHLIVNSSWVYLGWPMSTAPQIVGRKIKLLQDVSPDLIEWITEQDNAPTKAYEIGPTPIEPEEVPKVEGWKPHLYQAAEHMVSHGQQTTEVLQHLLNSHKELLTHVGYLTKRIELLEQDKKQLRAFKGLMEKLVLHHSGGHHVGDSPPELLKPLGDQLEGPKTDAPEWDSVTNTIKLNVDTSELSETVKGLVAKIATSIISPTTHKEVPKVNLPGQNKPDWWHGKKHGKGGKHPKM